MNPEALPEPEPDQLEQLVLDGLQKATKEQMEGWRHYMFEPDPFISDLKDKGNGQGDA